METVISVALGVILALVGVFAGWKWYTKSTPSQFDKFVKPKTTTPPPATQKKGNETDDF